MPQENVFIYLHPKAYLRKAVRFCLHFVYVKYNLESNQYTLALKSIQIKLLIIGKLWSICI